MPISSSNAKPFMAFPRSTATSWRIVSFLDFDRPKLNTRALSETMCAGLCSSMDLMLPFPAASQGVPRSAISCDLEPACEVRHHISVVGHPSGDAVKL